MKEPLLPGQQYSSDSWCPNPWLYAYGRPFPEKEIQFLVSNCLKQIDLPRGLWYEPGAGTGRIIRAIAKQYPSQKICATEVTKEMFRVLDFTCVSENLVNVERTCIDARVYTPETPVTLLILSSLLHLMTDWQSFLHYLVSLASSRSWILLIGERGDIYEALLGSPQSGSDPVLMEVCGKYVDERSRLGIPLERRSFVGPQWTEDNKEIVEEIVKLGYKEVSCATVEWTHTFRLLDVQNIIVERLYSSMFTADEETYVDVAKCWKASLENWSTVTCMQSRHSATARLLARPVTID